MDTITLCHVSDNNGIWDANYAALLVAQPPAGCCIWTKKLSGLAVACIWIKINCHDVLRNLNTTQEDIDQLTEIIRDWLGKYDIVISAARKSVRLGNDARGTDKSALRGSMMLLETSLHLWSQRLSLRKKSKC